MSGGETQGPLLFSTNFIKYEQGKYPLKEPFKPTTRIYKWPILCQQTAVKHEQFQQLKVPKKFLAEDLVEIATGTKWVTLDSKDGRSWRFPLQTILPKVQMPRIVPPKQLPRDVEVNRVRQIYAHIDLVDCLKDEGLSIVDLHPTEEQYNMLSENAFKHFLPISFFDSSRYDTHSPEAWMKLGTVGDAVYELPAKAFLPKDDSFIEYVWQHAAVSEYNPELHTWKVTALANGHQYEVPPVQIMFLGDDPRIFAKRLRAAIDERDKAESLVMMEIVDCVLLLDINKNQFYPNNLTDMLVSSIEGDPEFIKELHQEVYLLYEHMNAVSEFDKYVKLMPHEFRAFTGVLIDKARPINFVSLKSQVERKILDNLNVDIMTQRHNVMRTTLYYISAGIEAMGNVAFECRYVERLALFVTSFVKALPLSDFLHVQRENNNNVTKYLTSYWPEKMSDSIRIPLQALGKGWLDIGLEKWSVYQMYKTVRFLLQTKLRMQNSIQVLLERSIKAFSDCLISPCKQFLRLDDSYMWPKDFIETDFPYESAIFEIVISVNDVQGVVYSTNPEDFEPSLTEIFKSGLENANAIRLIDPETMRKLYFAPNLYIMSVELVEDLFVEKYEMLKLCYTKAVIPLKAYAKLYERFIDFYLLDMASYMREYEAAGKSSLQVKLDIEEHKRQKEELRKILPAVIVIGPFNIVVDPLKQFLIRKHIDMVRRLFEYYVARMLAINEDLMDQCTEVHHRITEHPQSIEHLYEIRDFATTVPMRVEQLKSDIQVMLLQYEMLDSFFYSLQDPHFALKWQVYAWPHKIMTRLADLREQQKIDIEGFKLLHSSECILFEERLESLNQEIQAFSLQFDPDKVEATAVEVKKTWKIITDLQKTGSLLQSRQKLFEMEDLSLEFLESIIESFTPYRNLWNACSDFHKLEDATIGNPIANIELEEVWKSIENLRAILEKSYEVFYEKPDIQNVATVFLNKLDELVPVVNCIEWLRTENWLISHWHELAQRSGLELKYTAAMNFQYLIRRGIMSSVDLIEEISKKADYEADAMRKRLEEEERERERERELILAKKLMRKCRRDIL